MGAPDFTTLQKGAPDLADPDKNSTCRSVSCPDPDRSSTCRPEFRPESRPDPNPERISINSPVIEITSGQDRIEYGDLFCSKF